MSYSRLNYFPCLAFGSEKARSCARTVQSMQGELFLRNVLGRVHTFVVGYTRQ